MIKPTTLITATLALLLFASCKELRFRIKSSDHQEITKGNILQVNKLADYRVDIKRVKGVYENQTGYNVSTGKINIESAKEFAISDAIEKSRCDFLVNPLYDIEVAGTYIKVTVEGYSAFYTEFKTVETPFIITEKTSKPGTSLLDSYLQPKR